MRPAAVALVAAVLAAGCASAPVHPTGTTGPAPMGLASLPSPWTPAKQPATFTFAPGQHAGAILANLSMEAWRPSASVNGGYDLLLTARMQGVAKTGWTALLAYQVASDGLQFLAASDGVGERTISLTLGYSCSAPTPVTLLLLAARDGPGTNASLRIDGNGTATAWTAQGTEAAIAYYVTPSGTVQPKRQHNVAAADSRQRAPGSGAAVGGELRLTANLTAMPTPRFTSFQAAMAGGFFDSHGQYAATAPTAAGNVTASGGYDVATANVLAEVHGWGNGNATAPPVLSIQPTYDHGAVWVYRSTVLGLDLSTLHLPSETPAFKVESGPLGVGPDQAVALAQDCAGA